MRIQSDELPKGVVVERIGGEDASSSFALSCELTDAEAVSAALINYANALRKLLGKGEWKADRKPSPRKKAADGPAIVGVVGPIAPTP